MKEELKNFKFYNIINDRFCINEHIFFSVSRRKMRGKRSTWNRAKSTNCMEIYRQKLRRTPLDRRDRLFEYISSRRRAMKRYQFEDFSWILTLFSSGKRVGDTIDNRATSQTGLARNHLFLFPSVFPVIIKY